MSSHPCSCWTRQDHRRRIIDDSQDDTPLRGHTVDRCAAAREHTCCNHARTVAAVWCGGSAVGAPARCQRGAVVQVRTVLSLYGVLVSGVFVRSLHLQSSPPAVRIPSVRDIGSGRDAGSRLASCVRRRRSGSLLLSCTAAYIPLVGGYCTMQSTAT